VWHKTNEKSKNMKTSFDVFISYNWKDEKFVKILVEVLEKHNISFFLDKTELKLYDKLSTTLKKNITKSTYLISLISPNYLNSYWCLFEAIEAISSEELNLKFLPIILKYNQDDPSLDENFVLESMEKLDDEIQAFETRIIKNKAFQLSSKLDKLNFIKNNLPKIFLRTQENIYPIFKLYDELSINDSLKDLIKYIKPTQKIRINNINLSLKQNHSNFQVPNLSKLPFIKWSVYVGKQKWKNRPVIIGNDIFVGSAGSDWNRMDDLDGVYCISAITGRVKWFYPTLSDVNELSFYDGTIIGGCDNGLLFCISSKNGNKKWETKLETGITSKVFKDTNFTEEYFCAVTYNGIVNFVDVRTGKLYYKIELGAKVMGNILFEQKGYNTKIYIPTIEGYLFILKKDFEKYKIEKRVLIKYPDNFSSSEFSYSELYSTPIVENGLIYQAFARQTYYDYPPIVCINEKDSSILWFSSDNEADDNFGNIRTELLLIDEEIIFVHPYSNELVSISKNNGEVRWKVELGRPMFQQWASPVYVNGNIYLARQDGFVYKINLDNKKREWSLYLGEQVDAGSVINSEQIQNNKYETTVWDLYKGFSLLSTPSFHKNSMIIGSDEGFLYSISNI